MFPCAIASLRPGERETARGTRAPPCPSSVYSLPVPGTVARNQRAHRAPPHGLRSDLRPQARGRQPRGLQRARPSLSPGAGPERGQIIDRKALDQNFAQDWTPKIRQRPPSATQLAKFLRFLNL